MEAIGPGGVALLTTPPAFRPLHYEHAVAKGCNVFMEKSFAVDAPGIRRVLAAGEEATKKNLKVAGGLMSRHYKPLEEAVDKIHNGLIGEVITCWAYREHGPVGLRPKSPDVTEMGHQVRNYSCYTWLNGSFILDWLIHNLDVCCWVKDAWPASAQGQGGAKSAMPRISSSTTMRSNTLSRTVRGCLLRAVTSPVAGASSATSSMGRRDRQYWVKGFRNRRFSRAHKQSNENLVWRYEGPPCNQYQVEHDLLFEAIRQDKPYNETQRCAYAAMTGILGRMAAESGQEITWDEALASDLVLAPGLEQYTMESEPPVKPDAEGNYPVALPGISKVY